MTLHGKYASNNEAAREFQDYVGSLLWHQGMGVLIYTSPGYQIRHGETRGGILEIKLDRRFRETGNLFIETEERHNVHVPFKPAGVHGRGRFYVIGDYQTVFLFTRKQLRRHEATCRKVETDTAKGFLLPVGTAHEEAEDLTDSLGLLARAKLNSL